MQNERQWCKEVYEASVSGRCWWCTPYDDGWDASGKYGAEIAADGELEQIVAMEAAL
ncbi:hypothetical protein LCGC14_3118690, partial [marine sediment metagenome]